MNRLKKNDVAMVIAGVDAGKTGKVLKVHSGKDKITVEGVNMIYKHVRRSQQNPQGGRVQRESPIHASKVMPYCEKCSTGVRVRFQMVDGKKRRVCAKCGSTLPA